MKQYKYLILALLTIGFIGIAHKVTEASFINPSSGNTIGATTQQTSAYYTDGNRTDSYTQNGNILTPYTTFSGAIGSAASDSYVTNVFNLSPTNAPYVDGAPDIMPNSVYLNGNQSTYVPVSGATFPGAFEIYDIITAGNLIFSSTSTTQLHQVNNSTVASGNITANGLINMIGTNILSSTSTFTIASTGLMNYIGGQLDAIVNAASQSNYNDMEWAGSTPGYGIVQSGCANGGCMNVIGMTYINTAGNGINVASSGASVASGTSNNLIGFSEVLGASATSSVNAGSARTAICDSQGFYTTTGAFVAPSGTNWAPCMDENRQVLNGLAVGTSSDINGFVLTGPNTSFTTGNIGGGSLTAGTCASTTTALPAGITTSSAAFVTTPKADPGADFYWETVLVASSSVSTRVCAAGITGTPTATGYNVKIIQ